MKFLKLEEVHDTIWLGLFVVLTFGGLIAFNVITDRAFARQAINASIERMRDVDDVTNIDVLIAACHGKNVACQPLGAVTFRGHSVPVSYIEMQYFRDRAWYGRVPNGRQPDAKASIFILRKPHIKVVRLEL